MQLIADGLLIAGALSAALYCWVLSRRVRGLTDLDAGMGAAISALSRQVTEMKASVDLARRATGASQKELKELTARAEIAAGRLELLLAALHEQDARPEAGGIGPRVARRRAARGEAGETAPEAEEPDPAARPEPASEPAPEADAQAAPGRTDDGGWPGFPAPGDPAAAPAPRRKTTPALANVLKAMRS